MRRGHSRGQSLVETTLILTAFMSLILGMAGVGQMLFVRETLAARVHDAARWGAVNGYNARAIRNVVLYGTPAPGSEDALGFAGLSAAEIVVANPGCPGVDCSVSVAIPGQGIQTSEPAEGY